MNVEQRHTTQHGGVYERETDATSSPSVVELRNRRVARDMAVALLERTQDMRGVLG